MESLYSQVVIISIRKSVSPVSVTCWVEVNLATTATYFIIFYLAIFEYFAPQMFSLEPLFRENGALPGMKMTTLSTGSRSVVQPLHRVFTL